jgi:hypothetical protein
VIAWALAVGRRASARGNSWRALGYGPSTDSTAGQGQNDDSVRKLVALRWYGTRRSQQQAASIGWHGARSCGCARWHDGQQMTGLFRPSQVSRQHYSAGLVPNTPLQYSFNFQIFNYFSAVLASRNSKHNLSHVVKY